MLQRYESFRKYNTLNNNLYNAKRLKFAETNNDLKQSCIQNDEGENNENIKTEMNKTSRKQFLMHIFYLYIDQ